MFQNFKRTQIGKGMRFQTYRERPRVGADRVRLKSSNRLYLSNSSWSECMILKTSYLFSFSKSEEWKLVSCQIAGAHAPLFTICTGLSKNNNSNSPNEVGLSYLEHFLYLSLVDWMFESIELVNFQVPCSVNRNTIKPFPDNDVHSVRNRNEKKNQQPKDTIKLNSSKSCGDDQW